MIAKMDFNLVQPRGGYLRLGTHDEVGSPAKAQPAGQL